MSCVYPAPSRSSSESIAVCHSVSEWGTESPPHVSSWQWDLLYHDFTEDRINTDQFGLLSAIFLCYLGNQQGCVEEQASSPQAHSSGMCVCISCERPDKIIHAGLWVSSQTQSLVRGWKILSRTTLIFDRLVGPPTPSVTLSLLTWQGVSIATHISRLSVCVSLGVWVNERDPIPADSSSAPWMSLVGATAGAGEALRSRPYSTFYFIFQST